MEHNDKQKIIGIITANASQSAQKQLLSGILSQAQAFDAVSVVFSNVYNSSEYFANIEIENNIYDLILSKKIDALIMTGEVILNPDLQQYIYQRLLKRSDIPIVIIGAELPGFICVNNDVQSDIEDIIRHLVEVHGFSDIDFITGDLTAPTSHERVAGYKKILLEHGIPFDKNKVLYGDFWTTSGEKFALEYINGGRKLPQAIACANDYMAYGLCDVFLANGINVPDDVTVVGYEYAGERFYHAPTLTTYQRNRKAAGAKAFNIVWEKLTGESIEEISLAGNIICGNSCPCGVEKSALNKELSIVRREQYYSELNLVGNFQQELALCRSIADYINVLQQFTYLIRDIKGLHLCLYENWCTSDIPAYQEAGNTPETMACYRVISSEYTTDIPVYFNKYELFPDIVPASNSGNVMYFSPVFFSGKEMGYFILQYDTADGYDIIFRDWLKIAANGLESLRMRNDIHTLLECMNLSAYHDSVTGIYNQNGMKNELSNLLKKADENDYCVLMLLRTGIFVDNSSLDRQDISVRIDIEVSENLKRIALPHGWICAKISDDLYALSGITQEPEEHINTIQDKLSALIIHSPLYSEYCGTDTFTGDFSVNSVCDFDFNREISFLRKKLSEQIDTLAKARKHSNYPQYSNLRNQIYKSPSAAWDAKTICRDLLVSYGHFRVTYKDIFSISFRKDIIRCRISYAKYLLLTTALNMNSIAYKCGYDDEKYFMRQFRQLTGMTPNVYRSSGTNLSPQKKHHHDSVEIC